MEDLSVLHNHEQQFSTNGFYFNDLSVNNSLKMSPSSLFDSKEDLHFLFNWQDVLQDPFGENVDLKCNLELKTDLVDSADCPILTNALTCPTPIKEEVLDLGDVKEPIVQREKVVFPGDVEPLHVSSNMQTDNLVRRITQARSVLINGEREIFGKNIIGLHSLNEIKTSPDENCQITSTVINGKRYKIIIRPKSSAPVSQLVEKCDEETACMGSVKMEPADELISELQNGDYDVLGNEEMLDPWLLPPEMEPQADPEPQQPEEAEDDRNVPDPPRVPPLRIKIPKKVKKTKQKGPVLEGETLSTLLTNYERAVKLVDQELDSEVVVKEEKVPIRPTRMHDAAAAISRNKFLCLVSGGDSVQLDHDYCTLMLRQSNIPVPFLESKLVEKNPRKDSGLESGGVSDASEESPSTDAPFSAPVLAPQLASKLLEERRRCKNHMKVTKVAAALFRAANAITSGRAHKIPAALHSTTNRDNEDSSSFVGDSPKLSPSTCDSNASEDTSYDNSNDKPKKKLKLEEYRSRQCDKEKDNNSVTDACLVSSTSIKVEPYVPETVENFVPVQEIKQEPEEIVPVVNNVPCETKKRKRTRSSDSSRKIKDRIRESRCERGSRTDRWRTRRCSSSSSTSGERERRRKSNSIERFRRSGSRDRRRYCRSSPRRSSSRDSSSSGSVFHHRSYSSRRYRRRSRSRSRSFSWERSWLRNRRRCGGRQGNITRRSRSPVFSPREKQREIEERRVIYVGRVADGTTNADLRQRFSRFGPIVDISLHFREHGDNYGFMTFAYKEDAYEAVEHGNDDPNFPRYDICFGGRRTFCKQRYSDLDGMPTSYSGFKDLPVASRPRSDSLDFDYLLKQAKAKLRHRKDS